MSVSKRNREHISDEGNKPYKDMKSRWIVLLIGFILCILSFVFALVPLLMFFVPEWASWGNSTGFSLVDLAKIMNWIAVGTGFGGIVCAVAGANTNKLIARLSFLFGVLGFFIGIVMALIASFVTLF